MKNCLYLIFLISFVSCTEKIQINRVLDAKPVIFPDYIDVTVPANIAPLHFKLVESLEYSDIAAAFTVGDTRIEVRGKNGQIAVGKSDWKKLMNKSVGKYIDVEMMTKSQGTWISYTPFRINVSADLMDSYIAYRLIEPGYELWNEMGIYQRCLENYDESPIITNNMTGRNCMNCHSFCMQNPTKMLFHMRATFPGTIMINEGKIEKLNTKTDRTISALVYPSWHPSGRFVAFSVNDTKQSFHTTTPNRIEVFDFKSDIVVYDVENHEIITAPQLFAENAFETFPTFSPDGKALYFCSSDTFNMPYEYDKVKYSLCSISFDADSRKFGTTIDTLYNSHQISDSLNLQKWENKSVSFPRVSPDGEFLMFTLSQYGNFSIWHQDADLYLMNLTNKTYRPLDEANSNSVESYHSWSSTSRWFVFSSRRMDGLYTRPFFAHIDESGNVSKPFMLPQKDANFYDEFMKSYNIPEFIKDRVDCSGYEISRIARNDKGIDVRFSENK